MSKLARNVILSGTIVYIVWAMIAYFDANATNDQFIFGAFGAFAFGAGTYWFGRRKNMKGTDQDRKKFSTDNS